MRIVNVAGPSDFYQPDLADDESLGQWLELAQVGLAAVARKKAQAKAKRDARKAKEKAAKMKDAGGADAPAMAGFSAGGYLPWILGGVALLVVAPTLLKVLRGR